MLGYLISHPHSYNCEVESFYPYYCPSINFIQIIHHRTHLHPYLVPPEFLRISLRFFTLGFYLILRLLDVNDIAVLLLSGH